MGRTKKETTRQDFMLKNKLAMPLRNKCKKKGDLSNFINNAIEEKLRREAI